MKILRGKLNTTKEPDEHSHKEHSFVGKLGDAFTVAHRSSDGTNDGLVVLVDIYPVVAIKPERRVLLLHLWYYWSNYWGDIFAVVINMLAKDTEIRKMVQIVV